MRVEVRCCCQPQKLLGWMLLGVRSLRVGDVISFTIQRPFTARWSPFSQAPEKLPRVDLPVAEYFERDSLDGATHRGLAFKSEETPIETLRMIRAFEEARQ